MLAFTPEFPPTKDGERSALYFYLWVERFGRQSTGDEINSIFVFVPGSAV